MNYTEVLHSKDILRNFISSSHTDNYPFLLPVPKGFTVSIALQFCESHMVISYNYLNFYYLSGEIYNDKINTGLNFNKVSVL